MEGDVSSLEISKQKKRHSYRCPQSDESASVGLWYYSAVSNIYHMDVNQKIVLFSVVY